ncbi:MAG: serine/threonine-protein kinase [Acidobacteriota bacterium]
MSLMRRLFRSGGSSAARLLTDAARDLARGPDDDGSGSDDGAEDGAKELAQRVVEVLEQALAPRSVALFGRRGTRYRRLHGAGGPGDDGDHGAELIPHRFLLPSLTARWTGPRRVSSLGDLPQEELDWLGRWRTHWVVPLFRKDRGEAPVGLLLIGLDGELPPEVEKALGRFGGGVAAGLEARFQREVESIRLEQGQGHWLKECPSCGRCFETEVMFCPLDDHVLTATILLERLVSDRYLLESKLGQGGMGAVYRATDQDTGGEVAVKLLTSGDRVALGRFANEAKAGERIQHPAVASVLDSGSLGQKGAFLVMEYVQGRTLREVLEEEKTIHPKRLAGWFDSILEGVAEAHRGGIIHRDLKPENIMIGGRDGGEEIKILDFGLAKLRTDTGTHPALTAVGMVIGTLSYMSPEQLAADVIDHRTDIFALAVMVSEALTGRLPFSASNLGQMLRAVATQRYTVHIESVDQARVADVLGRALEKNPAARYPDADQFRADLVPALAECSPFSPPPEA